MVNALKKMDKKFLIFASLILGLPIVIIILLALLQSCKNSRISYADYEQKMISAAEKYVSEEKVKTLKEGETLEISLKKLISKEYIKSTDKLLGDNSCEGSIIVRKNGSTIEENEGGFLNYIVNLKCDSYETKTLNSSLMKNLTTEGAGLYESNGIYVFKGEDVKNYINFYGQQYRIMSIDENGLIKLLKAEAESLNKYWDVKYNTEVDNSFGKNIYADSSIIKELLTVYLDNKKISKSARKHLVSKNLCVDSRNLEDLTKDVKTECNNVLENQAIALIDVTDFASASLDVECVNIKSKSCRNYNYMKNLHLSTWTYVGVSNNTYDVYYLSNGIINSEHANKYLSYNIVIYIDGNETYISGDGSEKFPYVIE